MRQLTPWLCVVTLAITTVFLASEHAFARVDVPPGQSIPDGHEQASGRLAQTTPEPTPAATPTPVNGTVPAGDDTPFGVVIAGVVIGAIVLIAVIAGVATWMRRVLS